MREIKLDEKGRRERRGRGRTRGRHVRQRSVPLETSVKEHGSRHTDPPSLHSDGYL